MEKRSPREDPPRLPAQSTDPQSALLQQQGHTDTSDDHIQTTKQPHPIQTTESEKHHTFEGIPHKGCQEADTVKRFKDQIEEQEDLTAATAAATKTKDQNDDSSSVTSKVASSIGKVENNTSDTTLSSTKNQQKQQQRRNSKPSGERLLPEDFEPTPYSVIIGRGKESRDHATGNHRLRVLVAELAEQYSNAKNRAVMSNIVLSVVSTVREASCNPEGDVCGAFIRLGKDGRWYEVSDAVAREKVGYTFREVLGKRYRSSSFSKVARKWQRRGEAAVAAAASAAADNMLIFAEGEEGHQETAKNQPQTNYDSNSRTVGMPNQDCFDAAALQEGAPPIPREQQGGEPTSSPFADNEPATPRPSPSWLQPTGIPSPGQQSESTLSFGPDPPLSPTQQYGTGANPFTTSFLQQLATAGTGHEEAGNGPSSGTGISNISNSFFAGGHSLPPLMPATMSGLDTQMPPASSFLPLSHHGIQNVGSRSDCNLYRHNSETLPAGSNDPLPPPLSWPVQHQQHTSSLTHTGLLSTSSQVVGSELAGDTGGTQNNEAAALLEEENDEDDCRPS